MAIETLLRTGMTIEQAAAKLCISPAAVRPVHDAAAERAAGEGTSAPAGSQCPYPESRLRYRCAWLAAHYDRHGLLAWETARA